MCLDLTTGFVARVHPIGDSIVYGVGATLLGGWRQGAYGAFVSAPPLIRFIGTQTGNPGGLTIDPNHEGIPGATIFQTMIADDILSRIAAFGPDIVILQAGTNDIGISGHTSGRVLADMSSELDIAYGYLTLPWSQIIVSYILRRKDSFNPTVQAVNAGIPAMVAGKSYASRVVIADGVYGALDDGDYAPADDVHPADSGYAKLADVYAAVIATARTQMNALRVGA